LVLKDDQKTYRNRSYRMDAFLLHKRSSYAQNEMKPENYTKATLQDTVVRTEAVAAQSVHAI